MKMMLFYFLLLSSLLGSCTVVTAGNHKIMLEDFSSSTGHIWHSVNDHHYMGGKSTGSFKKMMKGEDYIGRFVGYVADVPALQIPGFVKVESLKGESWPDISSCTGLEFELESHTEYDAFRVSFGENGYKANLKVPIKSRSMSSAVQIPFIDFTDKWDTGMVEATITCKNDNNVCPDQKTLSQDMYSIAIWGESIEGEFELDLYTIQAYGCDSSSSNENHAKDNSEILIEDFSNPINRWHTLNDPVMGGVSSSSVTIENGIAKFNGEVKIVPDLNAPGFVTMTTGHIDSVTYSKFSSSSNEATFPDISSCRAFKVLLRSSKKQEQPDNYLGYRISFGVHHNGSDGFARGFKASPFTHIPTEIELGKHSDIPTEKGFSEFYFPFYSFSASWDDVTGDIIEPCYQNEDFCPDQATLQNLRTISIWGEGVEGEISLEIKSISAVRCSNKSGTNSKSNAKYSSTMGDTAFMEEQLQNTQSTHQTQNSEDSVKASSPMKTSPSEKVSPVKASPSTAIKNDASIQQRKQRVYYPVTEEKKEEKKNSMMTVFGFISAGFLIIGIIVRKKGYFIDNQRRIISGMDYRNLSYQEIQLV